MKLKNYSKFFLITPLLFVFFLSCDDSTYKEWDKSFKNFIWENDKTIVFNPIIENITKDYNIILGIRHIHGFRTNPLNIGIEIKYPSGKIETKNYDILVLDESENYIASCSGDICDIEQTIENNFSFSESGEYVFTISQKTGFDKLNGIMEVGLIIE